MSIFRLAVTGGRSFDQPNVVWALLDVWLEAKERLILIHGDCPTGLDRCASDWSRSRKQTGRVFEVRCPANWNDAFLKKIGATNVAGFARNGDMLREFRPDILLAFPGGPGTGDCVAQAHAIGIEVKMVEL